MGIMVYSLLSVMQDLYHQPYACMQTAVPKLRTTSRCRKEANEPWVKASPDARALETSSSGWSRCHRGGDTPHLAAIEGRNSTSGGSIPNPTYYRGYESPWGPI